MDEKEQLLARYTELKPLVEEFRKLTHKLRPLLCPWKIDDRICWVSGGRKYRGIVKNIAVNSWSQDDPKSYHLFAMVIRTNGSEGAYRDLSGVDVYKDDKP